MQTQSSFYRDLAEIPVYTGAQFVQRRSREQITDAPQSTTIRVTTSVGDHVRNARRSMVKHVFVSADAEEEGLATPSQDQSDAAASYVSPSGRLLVVLREMYAEESRGKKRYVEVWEGDALLGIQDVTNTHAAFYTDEVFSSYGFDRDETRFVYTAEANADLENGTAGSKDKVPFGKYRFAAPLGEKFLGRKRPTLFIFRWNEPSEPQKASYNSQTQPSAVTRIDPQNSSETVTLSFGQATLDESGSTIYATGYEYLPDGRFSGIAGCYNRPSSIWSLKLDSPDDTETAVAQCTPLRLTPKDGSCRSPRYIKHDGQEYLVYLRHELGGPHHSCAQLRVLDFATMKDRVLVDTVMDA
ncbi:hypothetical protein EW145_g8014, partial [Phellinidium pouzarii]